MQSKKLAFVSCEMPEKIVEYIGLLGYGCVRLPKFQHLDAPVSSHPDMLISVLKDNTLLVDGRYYTENEELFSGCGAKFKISSARLEKKYPQDIAFDALSFKGAVYGRTDFIAKEILDDNNRAVNVKQGYALCSTLVTDRCVVTADKGIYNALINDGADVLKILDGGIELSGYSCGFIGGASVYDKESSQVIFFGDVLSHSCGAQIVDFLENHGLRVRSFEGMPLTDLGGAKLITI